MRNDLGMAHANLREMTMIDLMAFVVVAFALGTPGLVHLLWGQIEQV
jgi:hypothetical protein